VGAVTLSDLYTQGRSVYTCLAVIVRKGEEIFDQFATALQAEIRRPPYLTG
jgi:hypothetical protein